MSTSGTLGFINKNIYKGVYNHSDSYPSGLGQDVVNFCRSVKNWKTFKKNYEKIRFVDGDYTPTTQEIEENKRYANITVGEQKLTDMYCLLRNLQGSPTLEAINKGSITLLLDRSNFIKNSLSCEYGYVINLDVNGLFICVGFQREPTKGNPFGETINENEFYPLKIVRRYPLDDIPEDWDKNIEGDEEE